MHGPAANVFKLLSLSITIASLISDGSELVVVKCMVFTMYQRHLFHDVRVDAWTIRRGGKKPRMIISTEDGETEERKPFVRFECVVGDIRGDKRLGFLESGCICL